MSLHFFPPMDERAPSHEVRPCRCCGAPILYASTLSLRDRFWLWREEHDEAIQWWIIGFFTWAVLWVLGVFK